MKKYYSLKKIDRLFVDRDNVNFAKINANKKLFAKLNPKYNIKTIGELKYILNNGCNINISKCYCGKKKRFVSNKQGYTKYCSNECASKDINFINNFVKEKTKYHIKYKKSEVVSKEQLEPLLDNIINFINNNPIKRSDKGYIATKSNQKIFYNYNLKYPKTITSLKEYSLIQKSDNISINDLYCKCGSRKYIYDKYCGNAKCISNHKEVLQKRKETNLKRYGVSTVVGTKEILEKTRKTNLEKYGVEYPLQNKKILKKAQINRDILYKDKEIIKEIELKKYNTKKENNSFCTSKDEEYIYSELCKKFGSNNIIREYYSSLYPYRCDFYIKSIDLYIEYQGTWTHGKEPYDKDNKKHKKIIKQWKNKKSKYYNNAIKVWTKTDISKRKIAKKNSLNWLEFFTLEQFNIWLSTINSIDYIYNMVNINNTYNNKILNLKKELYNKISKLNTNIKYKKLSNKEINTIVLYNQYKEFYKKELKLWKANSIIKNLPLQSYIYYNRIKYLNKGYKELTVREILRAFKIIGIHYGYSHFNTDIMDYFVTKYNIKEVYDCCGGWGHRMLYAINNNIKYIYNDINTKVYKNNKKYCKNLNITNIILYNKDAKDLYINSESLFTCPPYFNKEIYSKKGIENKSYKKFLLWWKKVVNNVNVKYFAFVIDKDYYTDDIVNIVKKRYSLLKIKEFKLQKSHYTNTKKEYLYIFKR